ncbi:hypothetical protein [Aeromicrobium sp. Leaf350]|uniref:hypothetical protein n=1 Tax=Aeromicrobium sp. Leaf350 TaxID=2876565 RepID=UPI001E4A3C07|nr:hypothetical protein [Aeromicrobium sp. Leaf350]
MASVVVLAGVMTTGAGTASAAVERIAGKAHPSTYVGVEAVHGVVGVCTGNGRAAPTTLLPGTSVYAPTSAWALNHVTNGDGSNLDDTTGAAVATIVKNDPAVPSNHKNPTPDVGVGGRVAQIVAEANAYAGARSIPLGLTSTSTPPGLTWSLGGVGVQAPGGWMPGRLITLTASGPVVFEATGTASITVTSTGAPQEVGLRATGNGGFTVSAETSVPSNYVTSHPSESPGHQRITTRVGDEPLTGSTGEQLAVFDYAPSAVTDTSVVTASAPGVEVHDTIRITGAKPMSTLTGRSTLFGPLPAKPTESPAPPAGTPVVGTVEYEVTVDGSGAATVDTTSLTLPAQGYFVWQEEIDGDPESTPSPRNRGFAGNYGVGSETSLVAPPPDVSTQVSRQEVVVGQPISDTVTVTGTVYDHDGRGPISTVLTGRLYGPVASDGRGCGGADWTNAPIAHEFGPTPVTSTQLTFTGIGEFTPTERGCYSFGETLVATNSQGAEIYRVDHPAGRAEQTTLAQVPEAVTQINASVVAPGESFSDTVTISGSAGATGTFEATLWGPVAPNAERGCWLDPAVWGEMVASGQAPRHHTETVPFAGDGDVTTSDVTVTEIGCYTWSETFTFDDAPGTELESPPGLETETGMVAEPTIATVAQASTTYLGGRFEDVITLAGTQGQPGTLTGKVLTASPVGDGCTEVDWAANGTEAGQIEPIATTDDGVFTSSATVIDGDHALCATFVVSWTPDHEKMIGAAAVDEAGLPAETILFVPEVPAVPAGEPSGASVSVWFVLGLLLMAGGAGSSVWQVRRRRTTDG